MKAQYTADKPKAAAAPAAARRDGGNGLTLVALALAATGAGGAWYNHSQLQSGLSALQQALEQAQGQAGEQFGALDQRSGELESRADELAGQLEQGLASSRGALDQLATDFGATTDALSGDISAARSALTAAMESRAGELSEALASRSAELTETFESRSGAISAALDARTEALQSALAERSSELLAQLDQARQSLSGALESRSAEITGLVETRAGELSDSLQDTQMKLNRNQRAWLLSEVEYLLRTAVHRVMLAGDTDSAVEALKAAKEQLGVLGEVEYLPVANAIGEEITELRSTDQPDVEQLLLDLRALSTQAAELRMARAEPVAAPPEQGDNAAAPPGEQGGLVGSLLSNLQKHVSIKTPEGQTYGRGEVDSVFAPTTAESSNAELIRLNLQAAQLAALRRDQNDYGGHLAKARANVLAIYDPESPITTAFIRELDLLAERDVVPYTDKLGGALRLLRETNKKLGAG